MATYADGSVRDVTARGVHRERQHRGHRSQHDAACSRRSAAARPRCSPATKGPTPPRRSSCMGDRTGFAWEQKPRVQLHRRARRYASCRRVKIAAQRPVHRRRVHPPRLSRPDRPAADAPTQVRAFLADPRDSQRQARRAGRSPRRQPRVRRALDEQVGRPAAGESQVPRRGRRGGPAQLDQGARRRRTSPTTSSPARS